MKLGAPPSIEQPDGAHMQQGSSRSLVTAAFAGVADGVSELLPWKDWEMMSLQ